MVYITYQEIIKVISTFHQEIALNTNKIKNSLHKTLITPMSKKPESLYNI